MATIKLLISGDEGRTYVDTVFAGPDADERAAGFIRRNSDLVIDFDVDDEVDLTEVPATVAALGL